MPVFEVKFEPDDEFSVNKTEPLKDAVKEEPIDDQNEFHVTNLSSIKIPQNPAGSSISDKPKMHFMQLTTQQKRELVGLYSNGVSIKELIENFNLKMSETRLKIKIKGFLSVHADLLKA